MVFKLFPSHHKKVIELSITNINLAGVQNESTSVGTTLYVVRTMLPTYIFMPCDRKKPLLTSVSLMMFVLFYLRKQISMLFVILYVLEIFYA